MMGLIACIIAAVKGHKTFAWIIGIWTAIAVVLLISGAPQYAIAPGALFLFIAIGMKKVPNESEKNDQSNMTISSDSAITLSDDVKNAPTIDCGDNMSDPIYTCGEDGLKSYLASLRTDRQEALTWTLQSTYPVKNIGFVKAYKASTEKGYYKTVYFNINGTSNPSAAPKGFFLYSLNAKTAEEIKEEPIDSSDINNHEPMLIDHFEEKARVSFCRKCGTQLGEGSSFCRKCGTPIIPIPIEDRDTDLPVRAQSLVDLQKTGTDSDEETQNDAEEKKRDSVLEIDLLDNKLHPKIRRASLYAEDAEWDKADACLEAVLDEEPTNAYAYVGKLLIDCKVSKTSDLIHFAGTLEDNKNFQKACRFADDYLSSELEELK